MDRLISEQAVLNELDKELYSHNAKMAIKAIPAAEPRYCDRNICLKNEYNGIGCDECEVTKSQEPKTGHWKDFALWVANEIFVYEWEYNKDAFAEIACRKLAKLGIVREKDGEWELVDPRERIDKE